mmetsp:Transcript_23594/g.76744  ORF Transcript_23594/g.76744 Transcript_23594/m.76744 type:complete len:290 (-) Transcript_23594:120-989(-)
MAAHYGFVGMGIMGTPMALNLLKAGNQVTVWNRTPDKCAEAVAAGATQAATPADVIKSCSITFAMLADPEVAKKVAFDAGGVVEGIAAGKAYVDVSTVDAATSSAIGEAITAKGGRFLEAPVSGSKKPAIDGQLIFLCAGDESLYKEVVPALDVMGKKSLFLGEVGAGARMKLVVNMVMGSMMGAFSEGMALCEKASLSQQDLLDVLDIGAMANPMFKLKGGSLLKRDYPPAFPLKHQQKDMRLALALGDELDQAMPIAAAANEQYKKAKTMGLGDNDFAAVYDATNPK